MGGDRIFANVFFNCNRESADTGNIYTYNRLPLLSTTRTGSPSLIMSTRHIYNNLFFGNYGSGGGVDNDDVSFAPNYYTVHCSVLDGAQGAHRLGQGSSFYNETANVLYNLVVKHSTFTTGGHAKNTTKSLIVTPGVCDNGQGYFERFDENICVMLAIRGVTPPSASSCDPAHPVDTPLHPVPTPQRAKNTYLMPNASEWRYGCGSASWTLAEAQAKGLELGSDVQTLGADEAATERLMTIARQLLGL